MAITSEIIGKLGGRVEEVPVSGTASGGSGTTTLMTTINVPAGETWLVAAVGTTTTTATGLGSYPDIAIGDKKAAFKGEGGVSALVTGTAKIHLRRNWSINSDSFTGTVYTAKM